MYVYRLCCAKKVYTAAGGVKSYKLEEAGFSAPPALKYLQGEIIPIVMHLPSTHIPAYTYLAIIFKAICFVLSLQTKLTCAYAFQNLQF